MNYTVATVVLALKQTKSTKTMNMYGKTTVNLIIVAQETVKSA